jgi:3-deoxy-7-phosphoheptulonate synthase
MAAILTYKAKKPIVKIGRTAGQFAKPRSSEHETINGVTLPSYRGDIINGFKFNATDRIPDPARMEQAYFQSASKLNLLRAFSQEGYVNLNLFQKVRETEFYISHEALLLPYEQAFARRDSTTVRAKNAYCDAYCDAYEGDWYDCSAHMLWIGERTRQLDGAHVEFLRGVKNPVGLKCGPSMKPEQLLKLVDILNPMNEPGRLTLITRFGFDKIEKCLVPLLRKIRKEDRKVLWCCDPMHGNTTTSSNGYKTRSFKHILNEVEAFFSIHQGEGAYPGGVHFELTGRNVVECTGGDQEITEQHLCLGPYETLCDPRLNPSQAIELAFKLGMIL